MARFGITETQPVTYYPHESPRCIRAGCRRNQYLNWLCRTHADEAAHSQFTVLNRYIREARKAARDE